MTYLTFELSYDEHVSSLIELGVSAEEAMKIVTRVREENGLTDGQPLVIVLESIETIAATGVSDTDDIPDIAASDTTDIPDIATGVDDIPYSFMTAIDPRTRARYFLTTMKSYR